MTVKLFDSELKVMDLLWKKGDISTKEIAAELKEQIGWSKTTTYTVIKKCIDKGAIERIEPNFLCHPLVTIEETREFETNELIDKMYDGSPDLLVASILGNKKLKHEEIVRLKKLVEDLK